MTPSPRRRTLVTLVVLTLLGGLVPALLAPAPVASAAPETGTPSRVLAGYLCTGYAGCADAGYSHHGYRGASDRMWWLMYSGHNCTNYVAYRMVKQGMSSQRPWEGTGMAYNWGRANRRITDDTPMVGAVAWWDAGDGVGSSGHVAYVERVLSARRIVISEDSWGGDFHWRTVTRRGGSWPTGFVHFDDRRVTARQAPRVTGTPAVGSPLTLDLGSWSPSASYAVEWLVGGEPVAGATGRTLTPTPQQLRSRISARVTATARGHLPGRATTDRTSRVVRGTMTTAGTPRLSGTARVDEVLTLEPGSASPAPASTEIRWFADGDRIRGESSRRLRLGQDTIRARITASVVHRREGYRNLVTTTAPSPAVAAGHFEVTSPFTVTGRTRVGSTLTVEPGTFSPAGASVSYTWLRDGEVVAGATGATYAVGAADLGRRLSVRVDLRHPGYRDEQRTLRSAAPVTTRPELDVTATGGDHRAVVMLRLTAPGVAELGGRASVRVAGREVVGRVVDGRLRVVVRGLEPGVRAVRVRYEGTALVESVGARTTVRVRRR